MIGDQLKRVPPFPRYTDPEEVLAGKCLTCKAVVSCLRRDARPPSNKPGGLGTWDDLPCTGCPSCGAKVFLMSAQEFRKII